MSFIKYYLTRYPFLKQLIKFCIVGGTSAIINFSVLYFLTERLKIHYLASAILGFLISAVYNFLANKFWTFQHPAKGKEAWGQLLRFSIILTAGLTINTFIIYNLTEFFGFDYRLSWLFATGAVTFWNFGLNRFWTFKHRQESTSLNVEKF
jgi:putative flippase GtrA